MNGSSPLEDAILSLYEQHANDIYRYARLSLGDSAAAKDVVQEVFLRAFRSFGKFREEANPKTWLMSIARNHIVDLIRKKQRERRVLDDYANLDTAHDAYGSVETRMVLEHALLQLKDTYRDVFVLRHVQHHSVEESAQILGWTTNNVKTTDARAIAKLRTMLSQNLQGVNPS